MLHANQQHDEEKKIYGRTDRYPPTERRSINNPGLTRTEVVKKLGITEQTYYRWKKQYGGMDRDHVKRLKELEQENARLKKLLAEKDLDNDILKEALRGKY